jgi:gliding motility-associated-like protein
MMLIHYRSVPWRGGARAVMLGFLLFFFGAARAQVTFTPGSSPASCGNANGSISITLPTGGIPPYRYSDDGGVSFHNSSVFSGLLAGTYVVVVEDGTLPIAQVSTPVPVPVGNLAGPGLSLMPINATCTNNDGEIDAVASGGTTPYTFSLNSGPFANGNLFGGLASGNQTVVVKDGNGCLDTATADILLTDDLTLIPGPGATICDGTGTALTVTSNATGYSWTPAASLNDPTAASPVASPTTTTAYAVTATLGVCSTTGGPITVNVLPAPTAMATPASVTICSGQSTQLQGSGGVSYEWLPGTYLSDTTIANPQVVKPGQSISYALYVTGANGCKSVEPAVVLVQVTPPPVIFAGDDTAVFAGQVVPLDAVDVLGVGFTSYAWTPAIGLDNPSIQDPVATITNDITYFVTGTTAAGCVGTDSIRIKVVTSSDLVVPRGFTPNGDGHNDFLRVHGIAVRELKYFRVFNRWGQEVFATSNEAIGWDGRVGGTAQPGGVYVWEAEGLDSNGRAVVRRGTVVLIR